jgi:non-ribosomal peptide synthetase-like protein
LLLSHNAYKVKVLHFNKKFQHLDLEDAQWNSDIANLNLKIPTDATAYIIYTSGSTGRPKGVLIPHSAAGNLVKGERKIFDLSASDKVLQGFSTAFDASIEEIWLAFSSGACLFPVSESVMHSASDLHGFIEKYQISVVSTVPTMLSILPPSLPSLRLLILGGENCPNELLLRWHRENLRIVNTYGPTEATVIASLATFDPKEKISIGTPMFNYAIFITDASLQALPDGVPGELCIAGPGLAKGYLNKPGLTAEKFIQPKFALHPTFEPLFYRSGDLARYNEKGQIEFLGRIDSQIKLRGYRIELSEIESQLLLSDNIKNAVVAVREDAMKVQKLIAYVVLENPNQTWSETTCKAHLKTVLAPYMVPALFVVMAELPLLSSGKTDRKKLPDPEFKPQTSENPFVAPRNITEAALQKVWNTFFTPVEVSVTYDFFDIGGHSLLASLVISELRKSALFEKASVQDVYSYPSIEKMAAYFDSNSITDKNPDKAPEVKHEKVSEGIYFLTATLQTFSFFLLMMVSSTGLLSPFIIEKNFTSISVYKLIVFSSLFSFSTFPALILVSIVMKWLLIGRFKAGTYPLWGWYYFRFWLVKKVIDLTPLGLLSGTPFLNVYFRLMGAGIGKQVYLGSDRIRIFDLFSIGDGSSISKEAHMAGYTVENGMLIINEISIGRNCFVGTRAVLSPKTKMCDQSTLGELSHLPSGGVIPSNENWKGSLAVKVEATPQEHYTAPEKPARLPYSIYLVLQLCAILCLLLFPLLLLIPFAIALYEIDLNLGFHFLLMATLPLAAFYIFFLYLSVAALKWLIVGKTKEEDFSIYSVRYVQKWVVDMIMQFTLLYFKSVYATLFLPPWLRLMGAKVGKAAEISTVNQISTDLLEIGEGSFLADSVSIGSPIVRNGMMFLRKTRIGAKTFIGNNAVLACGDTVGNNSLIGVLSVPPFNLTADKKDGSNWLGSPPIYLPRRQTSQDFPVRFTFDPSFDLVLKRIAIEFFKITLPMAFTTCLLAFFYKGIYAIITIESLGRVLIMAPFILFFLAGLTPFIAASFKWILLKKHVPCNKPLWSVFVWKNELINSLCESMVYPLFVNMLQGTPYASWFFRMMGSSIGKKVFMETTEITEFDLVHIGDGACLNNLSTIQTHLFEDRVMKMSDLYIGQGSSLGAMSVALYDSKIEDGASIDALSLVMKGERIPSKTRWAGSPARFIRKNASILTLVIFAGTIAQAQINLSKPYPPVLYDNEALLETIDSLKETFPSIEFSTDYASKQVFWGRDFGKPQYGVEPLLVFKTGFGLYMYGANHYWSAMDNVLSKTDLGIGYEKQVSENFYFSFGYENWTFYNNDKFYQNALRNYLEAQMTYTIRGYNLEPTFSYMFGTQNVSQLDLAINKSIFISQISKTGELNIVPAATCIFASQNFLALYSYSNIPYSNNKNIKLVDYQLSLPLNIKERNFDLETAVHYNIPIALPKENIDPYFYFTIKLSYTIYFDNGQISNLYKNIR